MDFSGVGAPSDTHLYLRIAAVIESAIKSGELPPGAPLPSEQQIIGATGAARNTVRKAIGRLRENGLVYTVPHLGSFVARPSG
jgi:DNA-binding GntR family transcriptional regulator